MANSVIDKIDELFVETLGLLVLEGTMASKTEYKSGWLDGYARAYSQITGGTVWNLIDKVNKSIEGSGKRLEP